MPARRPSSRVAPEHKYPRTIAPNQSAFIPSDNSYSNPHRSLDQSYEYEDTRDGFTYSQLALTAQSNTADDIILPAACIKDASHFM